MNGSAARWTVAFGLLLLAGCPKPGGRSSAEEAAGPAADGASTPAEAPAPATPPVPAAAAPAGRLLGVIAPHAGHPYSGAVAGWAFRAIRGHGAPAPAGEAAGPPFPAQVAGGFYAADPEELRAQVAGFLDRASPSAPPPRAPIAAVVVLAFPHRDHDIRETGAWILAEDAYLTPLGAVPVDRTLADRIRAEDPDVFAADSAPFREEHALEVELPFLQVALPGTPIVPIMVVPAGGAARLERIGRAVGRVLRERTDVVLVVSTDLSHFYTYDEAVALDERNLSAMETADPAALARLCGDRSGPCGCHTVVAALFALREAAGDGARIERLRYANSGDVTGERDRVVGYGALAMIDRPAAASAAAAEGTMFDREERAELMRIAREAVRAAVRGERYRPDPPASPALTADGAAFVTLKEHGELRGCIGHVIATEPLYLCVAEVAASAAVQDPRFPAVSEEELRELTYDISVLTAPTPVEDPETVVVGRDGLIMSRGGRRGLLLPQVPVEQGWTRAQFLDGTCRKAGLPAGCWRDPSVRVERFQAIVWGEDLEDVIE
jgi:AmmeMemoRadiSam system protein A/AmmeMemoRadiSam system protein B